VTVATGLKTKAPFPPTLTKSMLGLELSDKEVQQR
jgi:hypothetical protein